MRFDETEMGGWDTPPERTGHARWRLGLLLLLGFCGLVLSACVYQPPQIQPTPRPEVAVHTRVKQALIENSEIDAAAINIETEEDAIVLKGFVATAEERNFVLETTRELYPDRAIVNGIEFK